MNAQSTDNAANSEGDNALKMASCMEAGIALIDCRLKVGFTSSTSAFALLRCKHQMRGNFPCQMGGETKRSHLSTDGRHFQNHQRHLFPFFIYRHHTTRETTSPLQRVFAHFKSSG